MGLFRDHLYEHPSLSVNLYHLSPLSITSTQNVDSWTQQCWG